MSATTTQLLSSGEFCKQHYDTVSVKRAFANVSFYANNSKMPNFELRHSCRKRAVCSQPANFARYKKDKFNLEQATKSQRGSRGIAVLFL